MVFQGLEIECLLSCSTNLAENDLFILEIKKCLNNGRYHFCFSLVTKLVIVVDFDFYIELSDKFIGIPPANNSHVPWIVSLAVPAVSDKTCQSLVLKADGPILVKFWSPWCGPCRMIHPIIDELAKQYAGKLKCYKVNTDESPSVATRYGIRSIPTVIIFKSGEKKDAVIGAVPKSTLTTSIEKFL